MRRIKRRRNDVNSLLDVIRADASLGRARFHASVFLPLEKERPRCPTP